MNKINLVFVSTLLEFTILQGLSLSYYKPFLFSLDPMRLGSQLVWRLALLPSNLTCLKKALEFVENFMYVG